MYRDIIELRVFRRRKKDPIKTDSDEESTSMGPFLGVAVAVALGMAILATGAAVLAVLF